MEGLLSPWHILIVLIVAVVVFGPDKLPEIARQLGRGLHEFRKVRDSFGEDLRGAMGTHDETDARDDQPAVPTISASRSIERFPSADDPARGASRARRPPLPESGD